FLTAQALLPHLAPKAHLLTLGTDEPIQAQAEEVYAGLQEAGLEVLWDERNESAGVKFADADPIGCPARVTLSNRSLAAGGAEVKARWEKERQIASVKDLAETIRDLLDQWPGL
ncbi:MAG: His/Gly/Thr/Pro-type tRNA ligase C-terminal domain-containing protein, partial [Candidatus Oleimicrobiaceae bacterium]